jgi:hypothetical protein
MKQSVDEKQKVLKQASQKQQKRYVAKKVQGNTPMDSQNKEVVTRQNNAWR